MTEGFTDCRCPNCASERSIHWVIHEDSGSGRARITGACHCVEGWGPSADSHVVHGTVETVIEFIYKHSMNTRYQEEKSAAEILAEETGEPIEKFQADDYEIPDLGELEAIDAEDYYNNED